MPRPIPSYRFHKASGQALVTLNGKDFYLGPWNSEQSRVAYDQLIAEWTANGRQLPSVVEFGNLSVAELLAAYLRHAAVYYSSDGVPTSEYVCMKDAIRPVREIYSRIPVKDFGPLALKAVRQLMVDSVLRGAAIRSTTSKAGSLQFGASARRGHSLTRIIQTRFNKMASWCV